MSKYHVSKGLDAQYRFVLKAGNGETILRSEGYTTKGAAFGGISSCKENAGLESQYERKNAVNGQPMFNLKAKNNQVIGTSETYSSVQARENGIAACKREGPIAGTQDDTGEK